MASDGILHVRGSAPNSDHRPRSRPARGDSASWCISKWEGKVKELRRRLGSIAAFIAATLPPRRSRTWCSKPSFDFAHWGLLDNAAFFADGSDTTDFRSAYAKKGERLQTRGRPTNHSDVEFAPRYIGLSRKQVIKGVCSGKRIREFLR